MKEINFNCSFEEMRETAENRSGFEKYIINDYIEDRESSDYKEIDLNYELSIINQLGEGGSILLLIYYQETEAFYYKYQAEIENYIKKHSLKIKRTDEDGDLNYCLICWKTYEDIIKKALLEIKANKEKHYFDPLPILKRITIKENYLYLPDERIPQKKYLELKEVLEKIRGSWNTLKQCFIFPENPTGLINKLLEGEKINKKKDLQFFETPPELADKLTSEALKLLNGKTNIKILEPSAGQGRIINALKKHFNNIDYCELDNINKSFIDKISGTNFLNSNFLEIDKKEYYDLIVANPPFAKNQDIDHFYKMFECLKSNGILICITSNHWRKSENKKESHFRNFLKENNAIIKEIPAETFKESGASISSNYIILQKKPIKTEPTQTKQLDIFSLI